VKRREGGSRYLGPCLPQREERQREDPVTEDTTQGRRQWRKVISDDERRNGGRSIKERNEEGIFQFVIDRFGNKQTVGGREGGRETAQVTITAAGNV
jgi:hypothetical protein